VLAGVVTTGGAALLGSAELAIVAACTAIAMAAWSARQVAGLELSRRDFERAKTPPRRAYVALVHDPNVKAFRPLLAVWNERPPAGERPPKPDSVWRCDDEVDDLKSFQGGVVVHEAWLDTGPRSSSKPRWVRADAGFALPHRRALLGRFYVSMLLRGDRLGEPCPLTLSDPHADPGIDEELALEEGFAGTLLGCTLIIALFVVGVIVLA